jgi:hypothetical protein
MRKPLLYVLLAAHCLSSMGQEINLKSTNNFTQKAPFAIHNSTAFPNEQRNFFLSPLKPAGDVNGDGIDDSYFSAGYRADDTTPEPYDRIRKSYILYGAANFTLLEEHVANYNLIAIGDINGDNKSDFLHDSGDGNYQLLYGAAKGSLTEGGVLNTSTDIGLSSSVSTIHGFQDVDGNGIGDVVFNIASSSTMAVLFGAAEEASMTIHQYTLNLGYGPYRWSKVNIGNWHGTKSQILNIYAEAGDQSNADTEDDMNIVFDLYEFTDNTIRLKTQIKKPSALINGSLLYGGYNINFGVGDIDADGTREWIYGYNRLAMAYLSYDGNQLSLGANIYEGYYNSIEMIGDVNNDNKIDFLLNDTEVGFLNTNNQLAFNHGFSSAVSRAGDLNHDGTPDLVQLDTEGNTRGYNFLSWDNIAAFSASGLTVTEDVTISLKATQSIGDYNKDGNDDFIYYDTYNIWLYLDDPGTTPLHVNYMTYDDESIRKIVALDYNGDGFNDLISLSSFSTGNDRNYRLTCFEGNNSGTFTISHTFNTTQWLTYPEAYNEAMLDAIGDVNGDGNDDLAFSYSNYNQTFKIMYGGADPANFQSTTSSTSFSYNSHVTGRAIALGDINNDNIDDFAFGEVSDQIGTLVYFGTGAMGATNYASPDVILSESTAELQIDNGGFSIASGDFNGDGEKDIATLNYRVTPTSGVEDENGYEMLNIYYGGSGFDNVADVKLKLPHRVFGVEADGFISQFSKELNVIPDINKDGADELFLGNYFLYGSTNVKYQQKYAAIVYGGSYLSQDNLSGIQLEGYSSIGSPSNTMYFSDFKSAVGDFDGNSSIELLAHCYDGNYKGSSVYEYKLSDNATLAPDNPFETGICVYPNPASNILYLKGDISTGNYRIYTMSGQVLQSGELNGPIPVSGLDEGVYLLQVSQDGISTKQKIIIRR